jgi:hypothetical protein
MIVIEHVLLVLTSFQRSDLTSKCEERTSINI